MADIFDMADIWNAGGTTFTAIKMNVTDTASAAASRLMDLQVGGASKFAVTKSGEALAGDGAAAVPSLSFINALGAGLFKSGTSSLGMSAGGANVATLFNSGFALGSGKALFWDSAAAPGGSVDLALVRDAAHTLAQRFGTNPQAFRLYNTYTDAANYERAELLWSSSELFLFTSKAGTGTARGLSLGTDGVGRWNITTAGHFLARSDNAYDIGATGANRPRDLFVGRNFTVSGTQGIQTTASSSTFLVIAAGVTGASQMRLVAGVAPTTPTDGDIWFDGSALKMRIGGVTRTVTVT